MTEFLTAAIPGTGGQIKETLEDFLVEEIPLYHPCGEGEHLYLEVEKRGLTTFELLQRLARALGIKEREIGYAGLKDARATTRQTLSLPGVAPEAVAGLAIEGVRILSARRHRNKLRLGHLAGNRFRIRVRGVGPEAREQARATLEELQRRGVPNRFGEQRYGVLGNSHRVGACLLRRDYAGAIREIIGNPEQISHPRWRQGAQAFAAGDLAGALQALPGRFRDERALLQGLQAGQSAEALVLALPKKLLRLYLSAWQSALFDRVVAARLPQLGTLWPGDLAYKHDNGACFLVADAALEQPRAERFEISPSGPLFGHKLTPAQQRAGALEAELLAAEGLGVEDLRLGGGLSLEGERRPLRVPLLEASVEVQGEDLWLGFALPKGSYATCVLAEVIKAPAPL
jgi:tRNA pseudouridine13 synthase